MNPIENKVLEVDISEGVESSDFTISKSNIDYIMNLLSNIYSNPIEVIVQEYLSNAYDANLEANNSREIIIRLENNSENERFIEFIDYGSGLDHDKINIFTSYGESTKQNREDLVGGFGIGCKSAYSYTDHFFVDSWVDNVRYDYMLTKNEKNHPKLLKLDKYPETRENGTVVRIPIENYTDYLSFIKAIEKKTLYFDNIIYEGKDIEHFNEVTIIEAESFKTLSNIDTNQTLSLLLGNVPYKIQFSSLDIPVLKLGVAVKIPLNSGVKPAPNREDIIYSESSKKIIKRHIAKTLKYFKNLYLEKSVKNYTDLKEFREAIYNNNFIVNLPNTELQFEIQEDIRNLSFINLKKDNSKLTYKNYDIPISLYKLLNNNISVYYKITHLIDNSRISSKVYREINSINNISERTYIKFNNSTIIDKYLRHRYNSYHNPGYIVKRLNKKFKLKTLKALGIPKNKWRNTIKLLSNLQKDFEQSYFKSYDNIVIPEDLLTLWNKRNVIQKGETEFTVKKLRKSDNVSNTNTALDTIVYDYDTLEDKEFHYYTIKENRNVIDFLWNLERQELQNYQRYNSKNCKYDQIAFFTKAYTRNNFIIVSKKVANTLSNYDNFKPIEDYITMSKENIKKYVTNNKVNTLLKEKKEDLKRVLHNQEFINEISPRLANSFKTLNSYLIYREQITDELLRKEILEIAEKNKLYNLNVILYVKKYIEQLEQFEFLQFIETDSYYGNIKRDSFDFCKEYFNLKKRYEKER